MKAIDQPFFKNRIKDVSKELYLKHGWELPAGLIDKSRKIRLISRERNGNRLREQTKIPKPSRRHCRNAGRTATHSLAHSSSSMLVMRHKKLLLGDGCNAHHPRA
jgi:hypothetical protein